MVAMRGSESGGEACPTRFSPVRFSPLPDLLPELLTVMSRVRPEDLSAAEVVALLGILAPADSRLNPRPSARPVLRIVRSCGEHPASDFA